MIADTANGKVLRRELVALLEGGQAHASSGQALENVSPSLRHRRSSENSPSVYEELEHMRIAQEDILRYTLDPGWQSPHWPEGYWPPPGGEVSAGAWEESLAGFLDDLGELVRWVTETDIDLTAAIPHGEGRTYLRQVLLVADHNAYHSGQIIRTRKNLGDWPPDGGA